MSPVSPRVGRLRTLSLPLFLLLLYVMAFGLYALNRELGRSVRQVERDTVRKVALEMAQLQTTLDFHLRDGDLRAVRESVAGMGSNPQLQVALLMDERHTVLASTRLALLERPAREAWPGLERPEPRERMRRAGARMQGIVEVAAGGRHVIGIYPVPLSFGERPKRVGFLFFQHDLQALKAAGRHAVERAVLRSMLMLLVIGAGMGLVVLILVGRRIQHLLVAARGVVGAPRPNARGGGEDALGRLGEAFDQMAEQIGRSRQQIEENEQRFQTLIERSPDATLIHWQGQVVFNNPAAAEMLGYEKAVELQGRPVAELVVPGDVEALTGPLEDDSPREVRWVQRSGGQLLGEVVTFPVVFERQQVRVSIVRDITERKQFQDKLNASERLASLGTLAAGVAHEINNPLSFMLSNVRYVREELQALSEAWDAPTRERLHELQEALEETLSGGERVRDIVRDLRTFSRGDEGRRGQVNVHAVLDLCCNLARNQLRHRARLVKEYGELPPIHASEGRLGQLFLNLIVNAAQAIPEGADPKANEVRLTTWRESEEWVVVEVKDTGVGIAPEHLHRLFDPFFTTKEVGEGTGLGLSICHGIVAALRGRITVESKQGQGSSFRIFLPVEEARSVGVEDSPME